MRGITLILLVEVHSENIRISLAPILDQSENCALKGSKFKQSPIKLGYSEISMPWYRF
jgi:hypothetical protein